MSPTEIVAGFLLGAAGSLHCAGMCGPIAAALPGDHRMRLSYTLGRIAYLLGKLLTYMALGAIVGAGIGAITLSTYASTVSIVAGALMIVTAVLQIFWHVSLLPQQVVMRFTSPLRSKLQALLSSHRLVAFTGIGMLNGLLPCGLVMSALFGSAAQGSVWDAALFMAAFGLGTSPMVGAIALSGTMLSRRIKSYHLVLPAMAIGIGALLIVRGMHLGIPMISPSKPVTERSATCCSNH